jgi:DNA-binding NtrC family response regulator
MIKVLCLSDEPELMRQASGLFSDWKLDIECNGDPAKILASANSECWDMALLDLDAVMNRSSNALGLVNSMHDCVPGVCVMMSFRTADLRAQLEEQGTLILQKPISAGEVGLTIRKMLNTARA